ncbi:MAG: flavodoxin reductase [Marinilabiliales bacterium]|nr:MAG: flavodoxin reductase [Marinilabiliales bacterium]
METHKVKILDSFLITHDVKSFIVERPENYNFKPGQATEIAINSEKWKDEKRPFTFTSLPDDKYLQFIIKTYPSHESVTNQLLKIKSGDELILGDVFGAITYQGPGTFIAGGAGITPFISIFRRLRKEKNLEGNRLIFANKTKKDIILEDEFDGLLGDDFINILSDEKVNSYNNGLITEEFLKDNITEETDKFYVCGPPEMMDAVLERLSSIGIPEKSIVKEEM